MPQGAYSDKKFVMASSTMGAIVIFSYDRKHNLNLKLGETFVVGGLYDMGKAFPAYAVYYSKDGGIGNYFIHELDLHNCISGGAFKEVYAPELGYEFKGIVSRLDGVE